MSAVPASSNLYLLPAPQSAESWLTAEQAMAVAGWSPSTFYRRAGEIVSRETTRTAPNGRPLREYLAASIPTDAAERLAGESNASPASDALALGSQTTLFAGLPPSSVEPVRRVALPDPGDQRQAEERLAILQPILDYAQDRERWRQLRLGDGSAVGSESQLIRYQAQTHSIGERTLRSWLARYRAEGFPALADRQRSDRNTSRWFQEHLNAAKAAAFLYLICEQSCRVCHESIVRERALLGLRPDELPSYETVRSWLRSMPPYLQTWAREGRRVYQDQFAPYLTRDYSNVAPNQVWVSDHMIHDVEVANDCFPELDYGAPMRLRFTCLFDMASRYVVGYSWCPEGSSRSIATALRRAFAQWGACEHFYCDNGKDYRKVAKGALPAYLTDPAAIRGWHEREMAEIGKTGILAQLGIKVTHCIVRHPQSKHIERFFRTLHERFDKQFFQHYTGGAPHLRPDATSASMEMHRKLMRHGRVEESAHPSASFLISACMAWIEEYHQTGHGGEGMNNRTPAEVFAARPPARPLDGSSSLALLFPERARAMVRECEIRLNRRRYTYADAVSREVLHELTNCEVIVAWDPNDPDSIAVLDEAGHFLCAAGLKEAIAFDPGDAEVQRRIGESMADRRHLEKGIRSQLDAIALEARQLGMPTPVEALMRTAALPNLVAPALTHRAPKSTNSPAAGASPTTPAQAARLLVEGLRK